MVVGVRLRAITIDVSDLSRSIAFYEAVFGLGVTSSYEQYVWLGEVAQGVELILQMVDDIKLHKNRVHIDVTSDDDDAFLELVRRQGGSVVEEVKDPTYRLTVVADPDGNEFCLLRRLSPTLAREQQNRQ